MRSFVDMRLSPALAAWLVDQGHDAVHAAGVGLDRAPDDAITRYAQTERRVIITADLDYPRPLAFMRAKEGLILFRGGNYSERQARERLSLALGSVPHDDLPTSIVVIEKGRIRRRRLSS